MFEVHQIELLNMKWKTCKWTDKWGSEIRRKKIRADVKRQLFKHSDIPKTIVNMRKYVDQNKKMTVRGTIVLSEVCNAGRFCLESYIDIDI